MSKTYIIGHIKPDTDAVASALALEFLYQQAKCYNQASAQAVIAGPINNETRFLLNKFSLPIPTEISTIEVDAKDQFVLVDHNEETQRASIINNEQVSEIFDHHKLNVNFNTPIFVTIKPWGSSCTVIFHLMKQNKVVPDKKLASMMLAAILSDTVGFKSATCTPVDKEYAQELAKIAAISDIDGFALEIFRAKSDISNLSAQQIITNDYKIFDFSNKKVLINQLETVEQEKIVQSRVDELIEASAIVKQEQSLDLIFTAITDVLKVNTKLLLLSAEEKNVAIKAFGGNLQSDHILDIGPLMSRKKEIAPPIEKALI